MSNNINLKKKWRHIYCILDNSVSDECIIIINNNTNTDSFIYHNQLSSSSVLIFIIYLNIIGIVGIMLYIISNK